MPRDNPSYYGVEIVSPACDKEWGERFKSHRGPIHPGEEKCDDTLSCGSEAESSEVEMGEANIPVANKETYKPRRKGGTLIWDPSKATQSIIDWIDAEAGRTSHMQKLLTALHHSQQGDGEYSILAAQEWLTRGHKNSKILSCDAVRAKRWMLRDDDFLLPAPSLGWDLIQCVSPNKLKTCPPKAIHEVQFTGQGQTEEGNKPKRRRY